MSSPCYNYEQLACRSGLLRECSDIDLCATGCGDAVYSNILVLPGVDFSLYHSGVLVYNAITDCSGVVHLPQPEYCDTYCFYAECEGMKDCSGCFHSSDRGDLIIDMEPRYSPTGMTVLYMNHGSGAWSGPDGDIRWDRDQYFCPADGSDGKVSCFSICRENLTEASLGIVYGIYCTGCVVNMQIDYYDRVGPLNPNLYRISAGMASICGLPGGTIGSSEFILDNNGVGGDLECDAPNNEWTPGQGATTITKTVELNGPGILTLSMEVSKLFNYLSAEYDRVFFSYGISCSEGEAIQLNCPDYCGFCINVFGAENCLPLGNQSYSLLNSGGDLIGEGTLSDAGSKCFFLPETGQPWMLISHAGNCYGSVSGTVFCSGVLDLRAPTAPDCVVHYDGERSGCSSDPRLCTLCDGKPMPVIFNMSDNFGEGELGWNGTAWTRTACVPVVNTCYKHELEYCDCLATGYTTVSYEISCENDDWKGILTLPYKSCGCYSCIDGSCASGDCSSINYAPQYQNFDGVNCTDAVALHADCQATRTYILYESSGTLSVSCDPPFVGASISVTNEAPCNVLLYEYTMMATE